MSDSPFVSVVMPVYNQQRYVLPAVECVLRQTFSDFELVIVNDGSTDRTTEILRTITDARVRVLTSAHVGLIGAREIGVRASRGKWLAWMDSDDLCHPDRLRRQLRFLEAHPECVFVGTVYGLVTPNGKYLAPREMFKWRYLDPADVSLATVLFSDPSAIFDRAKGLQVGLFDADLQIEKPLWYKLLRVGRGAVMGDPLYWHRWIVGSVSRPDATRAAAAAKTNDDVRRRYDPSNAPQPAAENPSVRDRRRTRHLAKAVNYYLLAGDYAAARGAAFAAWKQWPSSPRAMKLVLMASLRRRSLRHFWGPQPPDRRFVRADPPFSATHLGDLGAMDHRSTAPAFSAPGSGLSAFGSRPE